MTKFTDSLYLVYNNPFIMTPLFTNFFSNLPKTEKNLLLAYLLLPMVLQTERRKFLLRSNSASSIMTFQKIKAKRDNSRLIGLKASVDHFKELTNHSIQHALDNDWISIDENLVVHVHENQKNNQHNLVEAYKASAKLKNIFKDMDVVAIYRLLGIKKL